jgi:hypothetical protein
LLVAGRGSPAPRSPSQADGFTHVRLPARAQAGAGDLVCSRRPALALAALLVLAIRLRREVRDAASRASRCLRSSPGVGREYWYEVCEDLFYLLLCV